MPAKTRPFAVASGQGKAVWMLGQPLEIKVTGQQTGGAYAVTEAAVDPGFGPPAHVHHREDEAVYVLAGEILFTVDGTELRAGPGAFVHIPRGLEHTTRNVGPAPGRFLTIYTPAGMDRVFEELGEPITDAASTPTRLPDPDRLRERGAAHGLEVLSSETPPH